MDKKIDDDYETPLIPKNKIEEIQEDKLFEGESPVKKSLAEPKDIIDQLYVQVSQRIETVKVENEQN